MTAEEAQKVIDDCTAWKDPFVRGECIELIEKGVCTFGPEPCTDLWGTRMPSKYAVGDGPGSQAYVDAVKAAT